MSAIRWQVSPRPDTGVTNGTLGLWLFLAAEVMFFGSLLSSYVLLRLGNGELWAAEGFAPGAVAGAWKALALSASSVTLLVAVRRVAAGRRAGLLVGATLLLAGIFLGAKAGELISLASSGLVPRSGVATAMFYTVTGLHGAHLLVVAILLAATMLGSAATADGRDAARLRRIAIAWHFFVGVWLVFFVLFHLW